MPTVNQQFYDISIYQLNDQLTKQQKTLLDENAALNIKIIQLKLSEENAKLAYQNQISENLKYKGMEGAIQKLIVENEKLKNIETQFNHENEEKVNIEKQLKVVTGQIIPSTLEELNDLEKKTSLYIANNRRKEKKFFRRTKSMCCMLRKRKMCSLYSMWTYVYL